MPVSGLSPSTLDEPEHEMVEVIHENDSGKYEMSLDEVTRAYVQRKHRRVIVFASSSAIIHATNTGFFPPRFGPVVSEDLNGTFGVENVIPDWGTGEPGYDTWSCFKIKQVYKDTLIGVGYRWLQIAAFVRQEKDGQFVLFLNLPSDTQRRIQGLRHYFPTFAAFRSDPFAWHSLLIDQLRPVYDAAIWGMRDFVRAVEKTRGGEWGTMATQGKGSTPYRVDFPYLHDIARHLIHAKEKLEVADDTLQSVMHQHDILSPGPQSDEQKQDFDRVQQRLYLSLKEIRAIRFRAVSLNERLLNEINLAYNMVAQRNTELSIQLAEVARADNSTMKTLALVGVIYLPGTFISGIFGTNFFNYTPGAQNSQTDLPPWNMSDKFWVYWAVTIPVTLATVMAWAVWQYHRELMDTLTKHSARIRQVISPSKFWAHDRWSQKEGFDERESGLSSR